MEHQEIKKEDGEYRIKGRVGEIEYGYKVASPRFRWFIRDRRDGVVQFMHPGKNCMNEAFKAARAQS